MRSLVVLNLNPENSLTFFGTPRERTSTKKSAATFDNAVATIFGPLPQTGFGLAEKPTELKVLQKHHAYYEGRHA